jgi:hypothetical protein
MLGYAATKRRALPAHNAPRYTVMIVDFADPETERIWFG